MPTLRSLRGLPAVLATVASCATTATVLAHADDPKVRDRQPRVEAPAWRASEAARRNLPDAPQAAGGFTAEGVILQAWLPLGEFGSPSSGNDCWGYVSGSGREYAVFCHSSGTAIVEVTDPTDPVVVGQISGPASLWRDAKVFGTYAYVVSEGGFGVQVIDLSDVDAGTVTQAGSFAQNGEDRTHNVVIDTDSGFLYRTGGGSNGLRIYDLNVDPVDPPLVGSWTTKYVHDAQVVTLGDGRQIAYCCSGFNNGSVDTGLSILDVTDKGNIVVLGEAAWPNRAYSHQGWLSEDGNWFFINDELDEDGSFPSTTIVMDVSDLTNPSYAGGFTNGNTAITHNCYVQGDLLFAANYRSGLRVFDVSDPLSAVEVANFDTYPGDDGASFNGLWSVYPYFPSGTVIGSDLERGLFVWTVERPRLTFEYPDGRPDLLGPTGDAVRVNIGQEDPGALVPGTERLVYAIDGGSPVEVPLTDEGAGDYLATFPSLPCTARVDWYVLAENMDGNIERSPAGAPNTTWTSTVADGITVAFADDGEGDPGWTVTNVALDDGEWTRGVPAGGGDRGDPAADFDGSGSCWLTDNIDGNSDVDGGPTILTGPVLDLSGLADPQVSYAWWFTNDDGDIDRLRVELSDDGGSTWTQVAEYAGTAGWQTDAHRVGDHVEITDTFRVRFTATDNPNDSVTEAAVDAVRITEFFCDDAIPGDLNGDGTVGFDDLVLLLAAWGPCEGDCLADLDGNGTVDFDDLLALLAAYE